MVAQNLFEMFVFEGGQRFETTNLRVDRRRQGHGGARELPVLCLAGGIGEKVLMPQAALLRVPAPDVLGQRAIVGELDAPADSPCPLRDGPELGGEPVRRHHRVGIRARYYALGAAHLEKAGACSIHPHPTGGARSLARTIQEVEVQRWMHAADFAGAFFCFVRTTIEYQEDLVLVVCETLLGRKRLETGCYEIFLIPGGHDDAGPESWIRW
jgi:hypothetical protein